MDFFGDLTLGKLANFVTAVVSAFLLLINVQSVPDTEPINLDEYQLVFSDEFDGDSLNTDIWSAHNSFGKRKGGYWSQEQARVENGNLIIRTEYKEDGEFGPGWYTCGLDTDRSFNHTYGYYECRCILPKGQGLWSAFWLMNNNAGKTDLGGEQGAEIDVYESPYYFLGSGSKLSWKVTSNIHYNGYSLETKYHNVIISALDNNPYENYNTYGLLWTQDEYVFYVNGKEVARTDYGGVSQAPEYMILSCEVDGADATPTFGWSGDMELNDKATFCADYIVDYVRVYDKK